MRPQHARAQHRRQGQRDESGHDDRDRYRHRKFAEHAADDAAHQQHRDEHGDQREGDRDDREADLARAFQRGLERPHAVLDVADDVFQHDDGVVDHEADRQRQRQQRHVVDGIVERVHHRAGAEQRDRNRQRRNEGRRRRAQEQEDHEDDQPDRDQQRLLDVGHRLTDGYRAIHHHVDRHRWRDLRPQRRQFGQDAIDHRHRVGVRLLLDRRARSTRSSFSQVAILLVLDAVVDLRDFVELDRRTVAPGHHDLAVVGRLVHLAGGLQRHVLLRPVQRADRRRRIGAPKPRCGCLRATIRAPRRLPDRPGRESRISARRRSLTCATPGICDSAWPMVISPYSLTADSGSVDEPSDHEQHREVGRVHLAETRRDSSSRSATGVARSSARSARRARRNRCCG